MIWYLLGFVTVFWWGGVGLLWLGLVALPRSSRTTNENRAATKHVNRRKKVR